MSKIFTKPFNPITWGGSPHDYTEATAGGIHGRNLGVHTVETTQRYVYGTRKITWDGRVFKYSRSSGICYAGFGALNNTAPFILDNSATHPNNTTVVGDTSITIAAQTVAEDLLAGGFIILYTSADETTTQFRAIVGNTVGVPSTITVYLESPLTAIATKDATHLCAYYSPYYGLYKGNNEKTSTMGVPATYVSATGNCFWIQTWGPCRCTPGEAGYGAAGFERQMVFGANGALFVHIRTVSTRSYQHAGFIIPNTAVDDAPLVMLQISI